MFEPEHLLFALGILVAWILEKGPIPRPKVIFFTGLVIFFACVVGLGHATNGMVLRLLAGVGAACGLLGAVDLERRGEWTIPSWIVFVGDASYSIYLSHFMVVSNGARFGFRHWHRLPVPDVVWLMILVVAGMCAGLATYVVLERPMLRKLGKRNQYVPRSTPSEG